jgi:thioredoxin reductase (NADPH)
MSRYLVERIEADSQITVRTRTTVIALDGHETLGAVRLNGPDGNVDLPCAGLFSFIGAEPSSGWLNGCAALDDQGFVLTDLSLSAEQLGQGWQTLARSPLPFETSHPGLFAVGGLRGASGRDIHPGAFRGQAWSRHDAVGSWESSNPERLGPSRWKGKIRWLATRREGVFAQAVDPGFR